MEFLAECYFEAAGANVPPQFDALVELVGRLDSSVRHLRTIVLPEDETVLLLLEAPSPEAVRRSLALAGLSCDRVTRAATRSASDAAGNTA
jgi:hypothetical protein